MKELVLKRYIPVGGVNPNNNLKYINLEEVLNNTLEAHQMRLPVVSKYAVTNNVQSYGQFNITDIIGFVTMIDGDSVSITFMNDTIADLCKDYHVAFVIYGESKSEGFLVDNIRAVYIVEPNIDMSCITEG